MKRWRKEPNETGLAMVCQRERGLELRENGEVLATVAPLSAGGWYWYGFSQNTFHSPATTKEEAKAEVNKYVKENKI